MKSLLLMSRLLAVGLAACSLLGSFDASARTLDEIIASKKIVFGINPNLPPLGTYDAKNNIDGFDVSIAKKIADSLGVKLEIVPVGSNDRVPFLMTVGPEYVFAVCKTKAPVPSLSSAVAPPILPPPVPVPSVKV